MSKKISTLAVGAKVRDPLSKYYGVPVGFQIADKNHAGYPANSTTLAAEKILCLKPFDAMELRQQPLQPGESPSVAEQIRHQLVPGAAQLRPRARLQLRLEQRQPL